MSEKNKHSVSEELLFRYFAEEVSPNEHKAVLVWKNHSAENQSEFERHRIYFLDLKALHNLDQKGERYDLEKAWITFAAKNHIKTNKERAYFSWWKIAASILLISAIGWCSYTSQPVEILELTTSTEQQVIELEDGSKISLNKGSQLTYPEHFTGNQRKVKLKGEAYFEIAHNAEKPFFVETGEVQVQVLGTTFNVDNSNTDSIVVSVDTGKVLMSVGSKSETLTKGYRGIYFKSTEQLMSINSVRTVSHNYWRTKNLSFKGATVFEAAKAIEKIYKIKINFSSPDIANCKIHVDFEDEKVEEVLNIMAETLGLVWSNQGDAFLLAGYGCPE